MSFSRSSNRNPNRGGGQPYQSVNNQEQVVTTPQTFDWMKWLSTWNIYKIALVLFALWRVMVLIVLAVLAGVYGFFGEDNSITIYGYTFAPSSTSGVGGQETLLSASVGESKVFILAVITAGFHLLAYLYRICTYDAAKAQEERKDPQRLYLYAVIGTLYVLIFEQIAGITDIVAMLAFTALYVSTVHHAIKNADNWAGTDKCQNCQRTPNIDYLLLTALSSTVLFVAPILPISLSGTSTPTYVLSCVIIVVVLYSLGVGIVGWIHYYYRTDVGKFPWLCSIQDLLFQAITITIEASLLAGAFVNNTNDDVPV